MSITASWLVLAVVLLRIILKKAPKALTVCLWALVAIRLVFTFSVESVLSLIPSKETVPQNIVYSPAPVIDSGIEAFNSAVNPIISQSLAPNPGDSVNPLQIITAIAAFIWIAGLCAMLLYSLVSYLYLKNKVKISLNYKDNIFLCDNIDTPFILGIVRPRIYLPSGIDQKDMDYVLRHERAHLKRKDNIWKPLAFTLLSVYWFNPVLWIGYILLCRDIELACDEKVIKDFDCRDKKGYSEALISCSVHRRTIMACPLAFGEVGVKGRIKSVLNYKKPAFWIILIAIIASIVLGVCFLTDPVNGDNNDESLITFLEEVIYDHYGPTKNSAFYRSMDFEVLGKEKDANTITVYMWVLDHEYSYDKGLKFESGSHIVTAVTAKKVNDYYELVEYWQPRDGSYYDDDIKAKLPLSARLKAFNSQIYYKRQLPRVEQKALSYFVSEINTTEFTALKIRVPEYFNIPDLKASEIYTWQTDNGNAYGILPGTNRLKTYDEIKSMKPVSYDELTLILSYYGLSEEEIKSITAIKIVISDGEYSFGFTSDSLDALKKQFPQYFGLSTAKGLEVYVWQTGEFEYYCGLLPGRNLNYTNAVLQNLQPASLAEMKTIIASYGLSRKEVIVMPLIKYSSNYRYTIDDKYTNKIHDLFWDYATVSFNYSAPDFDDWGIKMDVTFKNGSDFEISLTHSAALANVKGQLTTGPEYEIKAIHNGKLMSYGKYIREVKGFGYEDKIWAWDTVLYTIPKDGVCTLNGTTKLFDDEFPEGEYVICKPVTLEDENGNRTTREYTYVFYAYR